jgi:hypothetical protein
MKAYFYTSDQARRAADRLGINFKTTDPQPVSPINGRPWMIEITLPESSMSQFPSPTFSSEVVGVVLMFDGIVHSQDQP